MTPTRSPRRCVGAFCRSQTGRRGLAEHEQGERKVLRSHDVIENLLKILSARHCDGRESQEIFIAMNLRSEDTKKPAQLFVVIKVVKLRGEKFNWREKDAIASCLVAKIISLLIFDLQGSASLVSGCKTARVFLFFVASFCLPKIP
jgi:hypothetical protein